MLTGCYKKTKERLQKRVAKGIKIFLKNRKRKSMNTAKKDIKIFLKKKAKVS